MAVDQQAVKLVRTVRGLTLDDLARKAGVDRATASRWSTGYPHVKPETADRLLHALMETSPMPAVPAK